MTGRSTTFVLAVAVVVSVLAVRFVGIAESRAFYFAWDMDAVTAADTLLIQSGLGTRCWRSWPWACN